MQTKHLNEILREWQFHLYIYLVTHLFVFAKAYTTANNDYIILYLNYSELDKCYFTSGLLQAQRGLKCSPDGEILQ